MRILSTGELLWDIVESKAFLVGAPLNFSASSQRLEMNPALLKRCEAFLPDWIYFGTLANTHAANEGLLHHLVEHLKPVKCFYDMNLREGHWNLPLVERLSALATVAKLNDQEAKRLFGVKFGAQPYALDRFCEQWSREFGLQSIWVTLGSAGCAFYSDEGFQTFEGYAVDVIDTVGAGDAFAAALLHGLDLGWAPERIASFANALGALIASRAGATPRWTLEECHALMNRRQNNVAAEA